VNRSPLFLHVWYTPNNRASTAAPAHDRRPTDTFRWGTAARIWRSAALLRHGKLGTSTNVKGMSSRNSYSFAIGTASG
jgi:hypothetical protein